MSTRRLGSHSEYSLWTRDVEDRIAGDRYPDMSTVET
jgi:hypothetical protein